MESAALDPVQGENSEVLPAGSVAVAARSGAPGKVTGSVTLNAA